VRPGRRSNLTSLLVGLLLLVLVDVYLLPADFAYMNARPNPYFLLSILFSVVYGLSMSFIAGTLSAVTFLLTVHLNLNYEEVETLIDFTYLSIPIATLAVSVILGELSDRARRRELSLRKEFTDLSKVEDLLKAKVGEQGKEITELRKRLVSRLDTTRSFFETARSFHSLDEDELLANLTLAMKKLFKTASVNLIPMSTVKPSELGSLSQMSIRLKRQVTLADLLRDKDSTSSATLILPIVLDDEVEYLLELSEIPFLEYVPSNFRISEIYGQWISSSLGYGRNFRRSERQSIWNEELRVHKYHYFVGRIEEELERAKTFMLPLCILRINIQGKSEDSAEKFLMVQKLFAGAASKELRKLDYISEGQSPGEFLVVLPLSDAEKALVVWSAVSNSFSKLSVGEARVKIIEWTPEMESVEALLGQG
jgi:hypothetical protein